MLITVCIPNFFLIYKSVYAHSRYLRYVVRVELRTIPNALADDNARRERS